MFYRTLPINQTSTSRRLNTGFLKRVRFEYAWPLKLNSHRTICDEFPWLSVTGEIFKPVHAKFTCLKTMRVHVGVDIVPTTFDGRETRGFQSCC